MLNIVNDNENNKKFLQGVHGKDKEVEKIRSLEVKKMKASIPVFHAKPNALYDVRQVDAFSADSVHLKKPSRWPKALIGPPCHGAPGRRRQSIEE